MYTVEQLQAIKEVKEELIKAIKDQNKIKAYEISQRLTVLYSSLSIELIINQLKKVA